MPYANPIQIAAPWVNGSKMSISVLRQAEVCYRSMEQLTGWAQEVNPDDVPRR